MENQRSNTIRNDREKQRCFRYEQKGYFKRDCIAKNIYMYHQKEEVNENINMKQEAKTITPKSNIKKAKP